MKNKQDAAWQMVFMVFSVAFFVSGCASNFNRADRMDSMFAMIYDYDNRPVSEVSVFVNGKLEGFTDIHGRFIFSKQKNKQMRLGFEKSGYEIVEMEVDFNPLELLYVKFGNANQYFEKAEDALVAGDFDKAFEYCKKTQECLAGKNHGMDCSQMPDSLKYLLAIILSRQKKYEESNQMLEMLSPSGNSIQYCEELKRINERSKTKDAM